MYKALRALGATGNEDEAQLRALYLKLVRAHSPERDPKRFAEIRAAYDELRDSARHVERRLFTLDTEDSLENLAIDLRSRLDGSRLPLSILLALAEGL